MKKVLLLLVALAAFAAFPAMALAQNGFEENEGEVEGDQEAESEAGGGSAGSGGQAGGGQSAVQQCQVGVGNCDQSIDQSQTFNQFGQGGNGDDNGEGHGHGGDVDRFGHGGVDAGHVGGVGGGGVGGVTLARTGFDAWVLALIGGLSLAGGLGLLAAQRRGRLNA
jgi:hypothetical protein